MSIKLDILLDLGYGDNGKGKLSDYLLAYHPFGNQEPYTHCLRFNGGPNAGHTIYLQNGKRVILHSLPCGVLQRGMKNFIGSGCVLHVDKFFKELKEVAELINDYSVLDRVKISPNTHIITDAHIQEEENENKIGTTKQGIGPAYRDKIMRVGIRAKDVPELKTFLLDPYEEFYVENKNKDVLILCEGAQGLGLDIDGDDYPYCTSSNVGVGAVLNNGFRYDQVRNVFGTIKSYETYVGSKDFWGHGSIEETCQQLAREGNEYGATTGRPRQVNLLNIDMLEKMIKLQGIKMLFVNKMDVMRKVGKWLVRDNENRIQDLKSEKEFKDFVYVTVSECGVKRVFFLDSPRVEYLSAYSF